MNHLSDGHQLVGFFTLIIALSGICMSLAFRRPAVFRLKLCIVFIFPLVSGLGGMLLQVASFGILQHTLNICFMFLITVLYWREVKDYMTTAGYHRNKVNDYVDECLDVVWCMDIDGKYTYVNKAFLTTTGLNEKDILGKSEDDLIPIFLIRGISLHICRSPLYNHDAVKRLTGYLYIGRELKRLNDEEIFFDNDHYIMQHGIQ